jgi:hypothetical protein
MLALPRETILHIICYLRIYEIEDLARTCNTTITSLCLPLLHEWIPMARNDRRMVALFGQAVPFDEYSYCQYLYDQRVSVPDSQLSPSKLIRPEIVRLRVLEYLHQNGNESLRWLQTLRTKPSDLPETEFNEVDESSNDSAARLQQFAERHNLTLPRGFIRFMVDKALQTLMLGDSCTVHIDNMHKLKSTSVNDGTERTIEGWVSRVCGDPFVE